MEAGTAGVSLVKKPLSIKKKSAELPVDGTGRDDRKNLLTVRVGSANIYE